MDEEEPVFTELGDRPTGTVTWEWGRDQPDGTRIDHYTCPDGYGYERIIPPGGHLCPELQGNVPGCEPIWVRVAP